MSWFQLILVLFIGAVLTFATKKLINVYIIETLNINLKNGIVEFIYGLIILSFLLFYMTISKHFLDKFF